MQWREEFRVWSSVCLNLKTQQNERKKRLTEFSLAVYLFLCFLPRLFARILPFNFRSVVMMCPYLCLCVGISRWIFYHFILYAMEASRASEATDSIVFGRISRIYDIIFSNQKYFSSKLLLYSKFFICFCCRFTFASAAVASCQEKSHPLFLCRAHISLIENRPCKRSFRAFQANFSVIDILRSFFFSPALFVEVLALLIGLHRSTQHITSVNMLHTLKMTIKYIYAVDL